MMQNNKIQPLLEAKNLCLSVPIVLPRQRSLLANPLSLLTDIYLTKNTRAFATLLENISLQLMPGDRIGLIGQNGAGKSTLLRTLAGIYAPSAGTVISRGSVKGLFDISMGMNNEATGLENIYLRGLQMGLSLKKIRQMLSEVIEFAELENHIDKPIGVYSSGMRLRLAVAVSTMIDPDILLLDEWIGAGDARFQEKMSARMNSLVSNSRGLVIATHNSALLRRICNKAMVMKDGKSLYFGGIDEALEYYKSEY